jgi:hypothetical protein
MRSFKGILPWLFIMIICASCGGPGKSFHEAQSLAEAKTLATQNATFIVIDFWRHG